MKLYVKNRRTGDKLYLDIVAPTRLALAQKLRYPTFWVEDQTYHVNEVYAQKSSVSTAPGAVIGGLTGSLAGPIGAAIGAGIGALIGNSSDTDDEKRVLRFNRSYYQENSSEYNYR